MDEVDRQRGLRAGADLLIRGLRLQLDEQEQRHEETVARLDERYTATIRQLEAELADARRRLEVRNWADSVVTRLPIADSLWLAISKATGGNLHTSVIEILLRAGAAGVMIMACPARDCRHREGPRWLASPARRWRRT